MTDADQPTTTHQAGGDGALPARLLTGVAVAVLATGFVLDRIAGVEVAYAVTRILALPLLVAAVIVALRRGARAAAFLPSALLVILAAYLGAAAFRGW